MPVDRQRFMLKSAVHLFLLRDEEVLLLRRYNTGYEDGNYSVVAGHLDGGEPVKVAMQREAREEVGIEIALEDLDVVGVMHRMSDEERIDFFLAAQCWTGEVRNMEPQSCNELCWAHPDALPENTIPYVRQALENYLSRVWKNHRFFLSKSQNDLPWFDSFGWDEATA